MSRKIINNYNHPNLEIGDHVECIEFSGYFSGKIIIINLVGQTTVQDKKSKCIHYIHYQWLKKTNPSRRDCR